MPESFEIAGSSIAAQPTTTLRDFWPSDRQPRERGPPRVCREDVSAQTSCCSARACGRIDQLVPVNRLDETGERATRRSAPPQLAHPSTGDALPAVGS